MASRLLDGSVSRMCARMTDYVRGTYPRTDIVFTRRLCFLAASNQLHHFIRTAINMADWVSHKLRTLPAKLHDDLSSLQRAQKVGLKILDSGPSAMVMRTSNCSVDWSGGKRVLLLNTGLQDIQNLRGEKILRWKEGFYSSPPCICASAPTSQPQNEKSYVRSDG